VDTWTSRELPVLQALAAADPPFIRSTGAAGLTCPLIVSGVTERARRAVGQWPASDLAADAILAALSSAADQEPDEEKRSSLRRAVNFFGGAGKEVLYRVVTQVSGQESHGTSLIYRELFPCDRSRRTRCVGAITSWLHWRKRGLG
jgi:hypothetical protein